MRALLKLKIVCLTILLVNMSQFRTINYGDEVIVYDVKTGKVVDHITESEKIQKTMNKPSAWYKIFGTK